MRNLSLWESQKKRTTGNNFGNFWEIPRLKHRMVTHWQRSNDKTIQCIYIKRKQHTRSTHTNNKSTKNTKQKEPLSTRQHSIYATKLQWNRNITQTTHLRPWKNNTRQRQNHFFAWNAYNQEINKPSRNPNKPNTASRLIKSDFLLER